jgi:hypothetical protein
MTEVLYCPTNNEILLFTGCFEIDTKKKIMTLYVYGKSKRGIRLIDSKNLSHIGWL